MNQATRTPKGPQRIGPSLDMRTSSWAFRAGHLTSPDFQRLPSLALDGLYWFRQTCRPSIYAEPRPELVNQAGLPSALTCRLPASLTCPELTGGHCRPPTAGVSLSSSTCPWLSPSELSPLPEVTSDGRARGLGEGWCCQSPWSRLSGYDSEPESQIPWDDRMLRYRSNSGKPVQHVNPKLQILSEM